MAILCFSKNNWGSEFKKKVQFFFLIKSTLENQGWGFDFKHFNILHGIIHRNSPYKSRGSQKSWLIEQINQFVF